MTADFFIQGRRVIVNAGRKRQPATAHGERGARSVCRDEDVDRGLAPGADRRMVDAGGTLGRRRRVAVRRASFTCVSHLPGPTLRPGILRSARRTRGFRARCSTTEGVSLHTSSNR